MGNLILCVRPFWNSKRILFSLLLKPFPKVFVFVGEVKYSSPLRMPLIRFVASVFGEKGEIHTPVLILPVSCYSTRPESVILCRRIGCGLACHMQYAEARRSYLTLRETFRASLFPAGQCFWRSHVMSREFLLDRDKWRHPWWWGHFRRWVAFSLSLRWWPVQLIR